MVTGLQFTCIDTHKMESQLKDSHEIQVPAPPEIVEHMFGS